MESPVRICLGAALVVNLLLLSGTTVSGNALPLETTSTTVKDDRPTRYFRINGTSWATRNIKTPDVALNELHPIESVSEEHTEKNAKYKDRGRVKFHSQTKTTTESPLRRIRASTTSPSVIIVTPTPEVKKPTEIIDSMRTYKKTKMPIVVTSTSTSAPISKVEQTEEEEEYEDEEDEEEKESFEKFTSNKFHESNFFTIPSFTDGDDFGDSLKENSANKVKEDFSSPSFGTFSSFFPKTDDDDDELFKPESYFNFDSELTTPKNDFFDKKFQEISKSIMQNLASIKAKTPPSNATNVQRIVKENVGVETLSNGTPNNKSTVIIKNTKEIRLLDNDKAGTANKELSDVHGTSIYYEMSVLSTETYAINHSNDDDCDNDTLSFDPTISTSVEDELAYVKSMKPTLFPLSTKPTIVDAQPEAISSLSNFLPASDSIPAIFNPVQPNPISTQSVFTSFSPILSTINPIKRPISSSISPIFNSIFVPTTREFLSTSSIAPPTGSLNTISITRRPISSSVLPAVSTVNPIPISTQNSVSSTEKATRVYSSSYSGRSRGYSKKLNLTGNKESLNSVTSRIDQNSNHTSRPLTRKFHYTTPKNKPIWMAPRRNITRPAYVRPTHPTTIYSEHFNIRDRFSTTPRTKHANKTLTTVSSEIDPVLQSDVSGTKKVVHAQSVADNTIPTLWKRGSTKFRTSTASSSEEESSLSDLEIPPTLTAWALASLRSPPSFASPTVNITESTQKNVDENELQKVGEITDKKDITMSSTTTTVANILNNEVSKKITDIDQNRLPWRPIFPKKSSTEVQTDTTTIESKLERQPAESNISVQSSAEPLTTIASNRVKPTDPNIEDYKQPTEPSWIPVIAEFEHSTTEDLQQNTNIETLPRVDTTKTTIFESITKLPSGMTTPQDDITENTTDGNNIATIRPTYNVVTTTDRQTTIPATNDYEITTIRFSYVPTEEATDITVTEKTTTDTWYPVIPTRTKATTLEDMPITTYRPKYLTTSQIIEDTTSITSEATLSLEDSSQTLDSTTVTSPDTTECSEETTTEIITTKFPITEPITVPTTTTEATTPITITVPTTTTEATTLITTTKITTPITTTTTTETTTELLTSTTEPRSEETTAEITEDTTTIIVEVVTEINTERERSKTTTQTTTTEITETPPSEIRETSEENSDSNEVIYETTKLSPFPPFTTTTDATTKSETAIRIKTIEPVIETTQDVTTVIETTTRQNAKIFDTTIINEEATVETEITTKYVNDLEDLTSYGGEMTTEASSRVLNEESGSGAAVAIAVSAIGVIALILLIGLLLVVRRRGRRGVYAQRCTPVSLDAYSLDSVSVGHRKGHHRLRASKRSYGNPAYDDEVTSHPMQYAALANFALDVESITAEFAEIPSVTVRPDEVPPGCEDKNRYSNVLPLPETRVQLMRIGNDPTTEYINANYITGPGNIRNYYIACQAPLPNTVVDFWRMIWEQNSRVIVMLTEYMENGVEKCYEYLPPSEISDNKRTFGDFQIILKKREQRDKYAISTVQLINLSTRTWREITHLWYFWPAKGVPDDYDSVIDFLSEMRGYMKVSQTAKEYDEEGVEVIYGDESRSSFHNLSKFRSDDSSSGNGVNVYSPAKAEQLMRRSNATNGTLTRMKAASEVEGVRSCVVVCASGAGRAAALVALDVCARALAAGAVDVPRVVRELRAQRPHALANRHHYIFLYKVLSEYGNKLTGGGMDTL